jgi:hypothetical protein
MQNSNVTTPASVTATGGGGDFYSIDVENDVGGVGGGGGGGAADIAYAATSGGGGGGDSVYSSSPPLAAAAGIYQGRHFEKAKPALAQIF